MFSSLMKEGPTKKNTSDIPNKSNEAINNNVYFLLKANFTQINSSS